MFRNILYAIVITVFIFIIVGLVLPNNVSVERSVTINRPASSLFVLLNSFHSFSIWSPLNERDSHTQYRFSGPSSGVGARMEWRGDPRQVGSGWQEIIESEPYSRVLMQLDFENQGKAFSYFNIEDLGSGTLVTWGFDSNLVEDHAFFGSLLARYFGLFFDQWIGTDYEQGLARLKKYAESLPATDFSDLEAEIVRAEPLDILFVPTDNQSPAGNMSESLSAAFQEISAFMQAKSIEETSSPMVITRSWDAVEHEIAAAIPISGVGAELPGNIRAGLSPSGTAVRAVHRGPYGEMAPTYAKLSAYMAVNGLKEGKVSWEHYLSDPTQVPALELVTHIYFLIGEEATEQN
jgi:effector-binding domain-containing protein